MLKILGFLLEFKNQASKGIEKVVKDTLHLDKVWKKSTKGMNKWTKSLGLYFDTMKAKILDFVTQSKVGFSDFEGAMDRVENIFGERVRSIVEALTSPQAAIAGLGGLMIKAGSDFERIQRRIRLELGESSLETEKLTEQARALAYELGTGMRQTESVVGLLAARLHVTGDEALRLGDSVQRAVRVSGADLQTTLGGLIEMQTVLGYGVDETDALLRGAVRVAQLSKRSLEEVMGDVTSYTDLITRLPERFQKEAAPQILQLSGLLGNMFVDVKPILQKTMTAITTPMGDAFRQMQFIISQAGQDAVVAFNDAIEKGDITKAFQAMIQGIKKMPLDEFKRLAPAFEQVFGMDIGTIDRLRKLQVGALKDIQAGYAAAAKDADFLRRIDENNLTLMQKLSRVWNRLLAVLTKHGEALVEIGHGIVNFIDLILRGMKWIMDIPVVGEFLKWVGVVSVVAAVIGGVVIALKIILGLMIALAIAAAPFLVPILLIAAAITGIVLLVKHWDTVMGAIGDSADWVGNKFIQMGTWIYDNVIDPLRRFFVFIWEGIILAAVTYLVDNFTKGFNIIKGVISDVGTWVKTNIIDPVAQFLKKIYGWMKDVKDFFGGTFGGIFGKVLFPSVPVMGFQSGGMVLPSQDGSIVRVAEGGQPEIIADPQLMRSIIGTDDLIDAVWGAAEMIVRELTRPDTSPSASPLPISTPASFDTTPEFTTPRSSIGQK